MKQYAKLGHYSENVAEFYIYDGETSKEIGSVMFLFFGKFADDYVLTNNEIDKELIQKLEPAATDLMKKMQGIL